MGLIKRRLLSILPPRCLVNIFLDVDNLENTDDIEEYIAQSNLILIFLSACYWASWNCCREAVASVHQRKERLLVHENDLGHGGEPLSQAFVNCVSSKSVDGVLSHTKAKEDPWCADPRTFATTVLNGMRLDDSSQAERSIIEWHRRGSLLLERAPDLA